jgi:nucleoside-diphosphate-sugar epimerase
MRSISIIGIGWLGLPLAKVLLSEGHRVKGTCRTEQKVERLKSQGIEAYQFNLGEDIHSELLGHPIYVLCLPPSQEDFIKNFNKLCKQIAHKEARIIFTSSTGIYPDEDVIWEERHLIEPKTPRQRTLLSAEELIKKHFEDYVILRFGGLIGPNRHPVKTLSGKKNLSSPNAPVNLIHQNDCLQIIATAISLNSFQGVYNCVSDEHPTRLDYYTEMAKRHQLPAPEFEDTDDEKQGKVVSNRKIKKDLNYEFLYPNPFDF